MTVKYPQPTEFASDDPDHPGFIYLLHFEERYPHGRRPQHYTGWANRSGLANRIAQHIKGQGARLLRAVNAAGINYAVARVYIGDRNEEKRLKRVGDMRWRCPVCAGRMTYAEAEKLTMEVLG